MFTNKFMFLDAALTTNNVWIGLTDLDAEGVFKWRSDDSTVLIDHWNAGQPNNNGDGQHCVTTKYNGWIDKDCSASFPFLCQWINQSIETTIAPSPVHVPTSKCRNYFENSCFELVMELLSWRDAGQYCSEHYQGGHLAVVKSSRANAHLMLILEGEK